MKNFDAGALHEIVGRLVGPINATGESHLDGIRIHNLNVVSDLAELLLNDIVKAAETKDDHRASMKAIGQNAASIIDEFREIIGTKGE